MQTAPVLALPDPKLPFVVHTDASGFAVGAVLMQDQGKGLQPIAFLSKKMLDAETRYPVHEQELLAIIHSLSSWRHYLHGAKFKVMTDHQVAAVLQDSAAASPVGRVAWKDVIANFDFDIEYIEGRLNPVADGLSRRPDHLHSSAVARPSLASIRRRHPSISAVSDSFARGHRRSPPSTIRRTRPLSCRQSYLVRIRCMQSRTVVSSMVIACTSRTTLRCRLVSCRSVTTRPLGGHLGKDKTIEQVKRRFYWPRHGRRSSRRYVTSCDACQRNKPSQQAPIGLLKPLPIPTRPWQQVSMDLITALPRSRVGQRCHSRIRRQVDQDGSLRRNHHDRHRASAGARSSCVRWFVFTAYPSRF